jgi:hypothetical protein
MYLLLYRRLLPTGVSVVVPAIHEVVVPVKLRGLRGQEIEMMRAKQKNCFA